MGSESAGNNADDANHPDCSEQTIINLFAVIWVHRIGISYGVRLN
jgi:hypothetical protein